jgi:hypothetical protein
MVLFAANAGKGSCLPMTTEQIPDAAATLVNQTSGKRLWMKVRLVWPHNVMNLFYFVTDMIE